MKYFIIDTTIYDGGYEYFSQSPVEAKSEKQAIALQEKEAKSWVEFDYREFKVRTHKEITKAEYDVVSKLIY